MSNSLLANINKNEELPNACYGSVIQDWRLWFIRFFLDVGWPNVSQGC